MVILQRIKETVRITAELLLSSQVTATSGFTGGKGPAFHESVLFWLLSEPCQRESPVSLSPIVLNPPPHDSAITAHLLIDNDANRVKDPRQSPPPFTHILSSCGRITFSPRVT